MSIQPNWRISRVKVRGYLSCKFVYYLVLLIFLFFYISGNPQFIDLNKTVGEQNKSFNVSKIGASALTAM